MYKPRTYRHWVKTSDLVSFNVVVKETDLYIRASKNLKQKAHKLVIKCREMLEKYIDRRPSFLAALEPVTVEDDVPLIVGEMAKAAEKTGVGPMAAVAGAVAEFVGSRLLEFSPQVIVENGGDIYLKTTAKRIIGIYAGNSLLSGKIGLELNGKDTPLGICTSSGTVSHSFSYGKADAVIALSKSTALSDAAATAIGNLILKPDDIAKGIKFAQSIDGLKGIVIIKDDKLGVWGEVQICEMSDQAEEVSCV